MASTEPDQDVTPGLGEALAGQPRASDATMGEIEQRIRAALDESMDACARCKTCDKQVEAVMAVIENEAVNRMAAQFVEESRFRSMQVRDGAVHLEAQPAREIVAMWIGASRTLVGDAENYVEMDVNLGDTGEGYTFHLSRRGKLTPHQARKRAEARAERAEAAVTAAALTERERIAQVAEDLGAHYHERLERTRGRSASFADFLRGASAGKTAGEEPA